MRRLAGLLLIGALFLPAGENAAASELEVLARLGPWPTLSALIGYRDRLWFANSVRHPDHNSADLYSYAPASGEVRFERHLFSQDVGRPLVAGGLLYWPYEDPRPSVGWAHIAVSDGERWQLRVLPGGPPEFHAHAMASLAGRQYVATSAWRAGLHVSSDGGLNWRQIYDHPTPKGEISRITDLADFEGSLFGALAVYGHGPPRHRLLILEGDTMAGVPGWPKTAKTLDLAATTNGVFGLLSEAGEVAFWHTDGGHSQRLDKAGSMPPLRAFAAADGGFWGIGDGALWHSASGRQWRRVQDLAGGQPVDIAVHLGQVYVGGNGAKGQGILWGPPPAESSPAKPLPPPAWPLPANAKTIDWAAADRILTEVLDEPESYRSRLRDLTYGWALAGPPPGFFEAALAAWFPDQHVPLFGSLKPSATNLGHHILLWGMGLAGRGRVGEVLLQRPWLNTSNRPQKWFDSLPMALFAVTWIRQRDGATVEALVRRLQWTSDPLWLKGDIAGALSAATGKRFGYDGAAWRQWWAGAKASWPR